MAQTNDVLDFYFILSPRDLERFVFTSQFRSKRRTGFIAKIIIGSFIILLLFIWLMVLARDWKLPDWLAYFVVIPLFFAQVYIMKKFARNGHAGGELYVHRQQMHVVEDETGLQLESGTFARALAWNAEWQYQRVSDYIFIAKKEELLLAISRERASDASFEALYTLLRVRKAAGEIYAL